MDPTPESSQLIDLEKGKRDPEQLGKILSLVSPEDNDFWTNVTKMQEEEITKTGKEMPLKKVIDQLRANNICSYFEGRDQDPVVMMMTNWYDTYESHEDDPDRILGFEKQILRIAQVIIDQEYAENEARNQQITDAMKRENCKYSVKEFDARVAGSNVKRTLLELCAEDFQKIMSKDASTHSSIKRNFFLIAKCIVKNDKKTLNDTTALELALKNRYDHLAAMMIKKSPKGKVKMIFETQGSASLKIRFADIIRDPSMKQTVFEVLNSTVSREWPHSPTQKNEDDDSSSMYAITDDPVRYHFHFQILEGDQQGRAPLRKVQPKGTPSQDFKHKDLYKQNKHFDYSSMSCLQILCNSVHKEAVRHPTVKVLARRKWDAYAKYYIMFHFACFAAYLIVLALSLFLAAKSKEPIQYQSSIDRFRAFCECVTIILTLAYFAIEADQLYKEGLKTYAHDYFNFVDVLGILGVLLIIPLRYSCPEGQWVVASLAYILNCLRIYKYFPAWERIAVYSRTLGALFKKEFFIFSIVYLMIFLTFAGATVLSLRSTFAYDDSIGFNQTDVSGFDDVFLRGIRVLAQAEAFASDYKFYGIFSTIVIMCFMLIMLVFMMNIFIAQLTLSYEKIRDQASADFDVAKALFISKLDNSHFSFWNPRLRHYKPGAYEHRKEVIQELVSSWKKLEHEVYKTSG